MTILTKPPSGFTPYEKDNSAFVIPTALPSHPAHWYLIDVAAQPDTLKTLYCVDPDPEFALPYIGSRFHDVALHGPVLIRPLSVQAQAWLKQMGSQGQAIALYGDGLATVDVSNHLATLNQADGPYGLQQFRYASPWVIGSIGLSLTDAQRLSLLGPLHAMHGQSDGKIWSLTRECLPSTGETTVPFRLTIDNLQNHARLRRQVLAESLAEFHDRDPALIKTWFDQLQALGAPSEQALVEATHLLVRQALGEPLGGGQMNHLQQHHENWPARLDAIATLTTHAEEGSS